MVAHCLSCWLLYWLSAMDGISFIYLSVKFYLAFPKNNQSGRNRSLAAGIRFRHLGRNQVSTNVFRWGNQPEVIRGHADSARKFPISSDIASGNPGPGTDSTLSCQEGPSDRVIGSRSPAGYIKKKAELCLMSPKQGLDFIHIPWIFSSLR